MKDLLKDVYQSKAVRAAALGLAIAVGSVAIYKYEKVGKLCDAIPACQSLFKAETEAPAE